MQDPLMQRYLDGKAKGKNLAEVVRDIDAGRSEAIVDKAIAQGIKMRETKFQKEEQRKREKKLAKKRRRERLSSCNSSDSQSKKAHKLKVKQLDNAEKKAQKKKQKPNKKDGQAEELERRRKAMLTSTLSGRAKQVMPYAVGQKVEVYKQTVRHDYEK